jgi:tripartite-type tricarboxylate transporter receptor subunit TctC
LAASHVAFAQAANYPSKPIRLIVGGAPGGGWDLAARLLAGRMQAELGQPVIVDNKPGADGIIAANLAAKAPPDGYTLMPAVSAQMTMNPVLHAPLSYSPLKDFEPVSLFGLYPLLLVVNPSLPVTTVQELIAYAKARPDRLNYAGGSSGFTFAMEVFKQQTGIDVRRIPYKGSSAAVAAVLAGDVQMAIVDAAPALPHVRAGKLKALAVTTPRRVALLPEVPSVNESAVPGYDVELWIGMFAPAGTPADIVETLRQVIARSLEAPDVRDRLLAAGIVPTASTPQALREAIRRDIERVGSLARDGRLSAD